MKLATLRTGGRDGSLVVVSRDLSHMVPATTIAATLQAALDDWSALSPRLEELADKLEAGAAPGAVPFEVSLLDAPLPRAYAWIDGSVYLSHMDRARELRNAPMPPNLKTMPFIGERVSSHFLGPVDPLRRFSPEVGLDLEGEIAVILDDVPCNASLEVAASAIRLVTLVNDVTYRIILIEQAEAGRSPVLWAKPYPTMAPVVATPDELGDAWDGEKVMLPLRCSVNGVPLGAPDAGVDMQFTYPDLIAHSSRYRPLIAGTVLAAGTISNFDPAPGVACIAERRLLDHKAGLPLTPWLEPGDLVRIDMLDGGGKSIFGAIEQRVEALAA
jgi:fumarylacetoacetate (FAA) hydrolase